MTNYIHVNNISDDWSVALNDGETVFIRYRGIDVVGFWAPMDGNDPILEVAEAEQFWRWASEARNGEDWSEPQTEWAISDTTLDLTHQTEAIDDALREIAFARRKHETLEALKAMADDFGAVEEFLAVHGYTTKEGA